MSLSKRVERLEAEVASLRQEVRQNGGKDWRRTIGAFTDDDGMKEILAEAMKLRETDRKKARAKRGKSRRPRQ
jgi:hypothetical protein